MVDIPILLELHKLDEMVHNKMDNVPLYHTRPMMDMDSHKHREVSMTLVLASRNMDMNMTH